MEEITQTQFFWLQDNQSSPKVVKITGGNLEKSVHSETGDIVYRNSRGSWFRSIRGYYFAEKKLLKVLPK